MAVSKSSLMKSFGGLLRRQRVALGISQEELGYRAALDRTYISGLERGVRNPSLTALAAVAAGLGVSVSCLLKNLEREREGDDEA